MKRDPRLRGLSSDHHQGLVLARRVGRRAEAGTLDMDLAREVAERFRSELEPHFSVEEDVLLTALRDLGEHELSDRTLDDHAFLRARVRSALDGTVEALAEFADRLHDHIRFEERTLFPACEEKLADAVLEEAARRAPKD